MVPQHGGVRQAGVREATNQLDYDDEVAFHAVALAARRRAQRADRRPFFLTVSFTHPHDPYVARPAHWDLYEGDAIDPPRVPRAVPEELPIAHSRRLRRGVRRWTSAAVTAARGARGRGGPTTPSISYVDERVGEMLGGAATGSAWPRTRWCC